MVRSLILFFDTEGGVTRNGKYVSIWDISMLFDSLWNVNYEKNTLTRISNCIGNLQFSHSKHAKQGW